MSRSKQKFRSPVAAIHLLTVSIALSVLSAIGIAQTSPPDDSSRAARIYPDQMSLSFAAVAKAVAPAVVSIDTKGKMPEFTTKGEVKPGDSDDVLDFFRRQLPRRPSYSVGSGFIIDKRGYIMTNAHVVADAVRITVKLDSGEEFLAKIVGEDEETDLAILKIETGKDLPIAKLGDSSLSEIGDWVLAIGSPFGLSRSVTAGIISQMNRETPSTTPFQKFIQTDAAINRGNSGGPLVNMKGEVIGINSQIATSNGDSNGVGFAFPSRDAIFVFDQILKNGKVRRGFLGVNLESVKPEFAKVYGMKEAKGAIVTEVRDSTKSAAGLAGLQAGDVIVEFDGKPVESALDLIAKVSATPPEQSVALYYLREVGSNLERKMTTLRLGERDTEGKRSGDPAPERLPLNRIKEDVRPFGLTLTEITPNLATLYKLEGQKGLIIKEINPESYIADVKASNGFDALGEGDLIQRINRVTVTDLKSFTAIVSKLKPGDPVVLHVLTFNPRTRLSLIRIVQFSVQ
ncbi:MAG: trypsin-like peptidase domain-containing protein [Pyrinomonadaceae bacterium]